VGLGVGTVFALQAMSKNSQSNSSGCEGDVCDGDGMQLRRDARSAGNVATVGFIAGGVLLAGGVTLILLAPKASAPQVGLAAVVGPNGMSSVSMTGRF
jgi:TPP-dependent pyruvate/acetoin dehydrogenase alpha subunit